MSAPLALYQSRDAAVRQTFFEAAGAAVAVSSATGSPSSTVPPPPLPPPPPGHSGRQQQPAGENSGAGRTGSGHNTSATSLRDKAAVCNSNATPAETDTNPAADEVHDTAALLQLHLQLNQHLQRGQQLVSDADIIRALKRLALNSAGTSGATESASLPTSAGSTTEQQPPRGKLSASSYTSLSNGYKGHSYGRGGSDRSALPVRDADLGSNGVRGSVLGSGSASSNHGGSQATPPTGSAGPTLHERTALTGPKATETAYGKSRSLADNMSQPPAPAGAQQSRSGQNTANGKTSSQGKQAGAQPWRCRACDAVNVGQLGSRCSCCGKPQQAVHQNSGTHTVPQQPGTGRRSQHGHKQLHQQGTIQQQQQHQNLQLQQLQRDVLLAAVSAAAAAAEKRADDKKVKRAAAATAAIAAESHQPHGTGREHNSYSQCAPYVATCGSKEQLSASQNLRKENSENGTSGLPSAPGGTLPSESDNAFELFLTENFLRQQQHGHIGSGRLLTEDGYEDNTAAAAAAAAAAATLFPGLLQSLEHSSASTVQTKGLSSSLHDASSGHVQPPQLTRTGSDNTNGAASTSYSTPMGFSSELLEAFSPLERDEMGCERVASCLSGSSGVAETPSLIGNTRSSCSRESLQAGSIGTAGDGLSLNSSTTGKPSAGPGRVEAPPAFSEGILGDAYGAQAAGACFLGNNSRSRLVGACGSYQGPGENVLSSAPGLSAGKASTILPGCVGGGCGSTPFSSSTLLAEGDTPLDGAATTTGMNIMSFQEFASAPQSTLYGDVITPGSDTLNLLGDCRILSSATPSSLLSRSESNGMFSGRVHVVRTTSTQRRSGLGDIDIAHPGGDGSSRVDRCRNKNAVGTEDTLFNSGTDDNRSSTRRDVGVDGRGSGSLSGSKKGAIGRHQSGGRIDHNGIQVQTLAVARSNRGHSSHQGDAYAEALGQQPQQTLTAPVPAIAAGAAVEQPFRHTSLQQQQQLLQGTGVSGDSPQCSGGSDSSLARSLPLSSIASSPSAGIGVEEISPLAFTNGNTTGPLDSNAEGVSGAGTLPMDAASLEALLPSFLSPVQILLLEAKEVADRLVEEFTTLGYADPKSKAAEALRSSLAILSYTSATSTDDSPDDELKSLIAGGKNCIRSGGTGLTNGDRSVAGGGAPTGVHKNGAGDGDGATGGLSEDTCRKSKNANWVQGVGGPHFSAPAMLAHPDEFKNPSSFLKIYGDPMCAAAEANSSSPQAGLHGFGGRGGPRSGSGGANGRSGDGSSGGSNLPIKGHNGNWVCDSCSNVNFPRRFRCNKCGAMRGAQGDAIVAEYAKLVYHQHLKTYRNLASRPGVDLPLKRLQGSAGSGVSGSGAGGSGAGNGGTKKGTSSYCSPSSNGGSTTTNSINGSTPSTPSDTANITALQSMAMSTGSPNGTTSSTSHYSSITDGIHPAGSEGSRAGRGSRLPATAHSSGGAGTQGAHRSQNSKGQAASEPHSLAQSTCSEATGGAGNGSSCCFPGSATLPGPVAAAAAARLQREASYDDNSALRGVSQYVSGSPAVNRGSTAKNSRARRASLSGGLPDSSPQTRRRAGNCIVGTAERQRGFGAAPSTRSARAAHTNFLDDGKERRDTKLCATNCSTSDGEKNDRNSDARGDETAFNKEKLTGNKQTPLDNEAGRGRSAGPVTNAVTHTPKGKRVSSVDAEREALSTLAIGKSAEGTECDRKPSAAAKSTKDEILNTIIDLETRSARVSTEGNTSSLVM